MIYLYFTETGVDWWSNTEPTPEQLDDENLIIWRVQANVIDLLLRRDVERFRWEPQFHVGGLPYRYLYHGIWGNESRCSTTWQQHLAEADDGMAYDVFRITSKPDFEYKYVVEFWGQDGGWFPLEQR